MDPVFSTMLDTVRIVTFQPRETNTETRRFAQEHELRAADEVAAKRLASAAALTTTREPGCFRGWFRFAFMAR